MTSGGNYTETLFLRKGGALPGVCLLVGTITLVAGAETIDPGNADTNVEGSGSLRRFIRWGFTNRTTARVPTVVQSWNATQQGDILTVTGAGTDIYDFWIEGYDSGIDVT